MFAQQSHLEAPRLRSDRMLALDVQAAAARVTKADLSISVQHGIVLIAGRADRRTADAARRAALGVLGVRHVIDMTRADDCPTGSR